MSAPTPLVLRLSLRQIPPREAGKDTKAGGLCQAGVQAEPGAGRAGWHQHGAEQCARVPRWHAAGNGEWLMPGALPVRGNPIRAQLCFWCGMRAPGPGRLSLQPLRYSSRGRSPVLYGSSSRAVPIFFTSKASSHGVVFHMHLGQGRPLKPISSTTCLLQ